VKISRVESLVVIRNALDSNLGTDPRLIISSLSFSLTFNIQTKRGYFPKTTSRCLIFNQVDQQSKF